MTRTTTLFSASITAALLAGVSAAQAELLYGFNDATLNGFTKTYDQDGTAALSLSTTNGVTEGSGALHLAIGPTGGGYDQVDFGPGSVPANLINPATTSLSVSGTANYGNSAYITLAPALFLDGTTDGTAAIAYKFLFPSTTFAYDTGVTPVTKTFNLRIRDPYATARPANFQGNGQPATPADGHSTTATYTVGEIAAQLAMALKANNPNANVAIDGFAFEVTANTNPDTSLTDFGADLYLDNVTIPNLVPEPAALSLLAVGGLALKRRRAR